VFVVIGKHALTPASLILILLAIAWLVSGLFFVPEGLWTDDEIIYVGMIDRFVTAGSFIIENGYDVIPAESLRLVTLRVGPDGLAPQYPSGFAILAAPFYILGGLQGVIFLNTLASVLTLWLTYLIALELFDDRRLAENAALIFGLATFAVDYAFAIWPHATANLFLAGGIYAAVLSVTRDESAWRWAALAGLMIGLGVTMRVDLIIAAPVMLAWLFVNAKSPGRTLTAFTAAMAIGLALAAWLNFLKFGVFNPLSYGTEVGAKSNLSLGGYVQFLPYALAGGVLALSLRWRQPRELVTGKGGLIILAAVALVVALVPVTRELSLKILNGFYALVIDLRHLAAIDTHSRIENVGGEYYLYYGTLKKSLLENLPYLGLTVFAVVGMFKSRRRAAYALCLVLPLVWFMPFILKEWIGGRANNLRYFSPMLPMLAILAAAAWRAICREKRLSGRGLWLIVTVSILVSVILLYSWSARSETLGFTEAFFVTGGAQWIALILLLFSLAWVFLPFLRLRIRLPFAILVQTAFMLAFVSAYGSDAFKTWEVREEVEWHAQSISYIEPNAHVFATGQFALYFLLTRPEATLAFHEPADIHSDLKFIDMALKQGRPVYIMTIELTRIVRKALKNAGYNYGPGGIEIERSVSSVDGQHYGLYRLTRNKKK